MVGLNSHFMSTDSKKVNKNMYRRNMHGLKRGLALLLALLLTLTFGISEHSIYAAEYDTQYYGQDDVNIETNIEKGFDLEHSSDIEHSSAKVSSFGFTGSFDGDNYPAVNSSSGSGDNLNVNENLNGVELSGSGSGDDADSNAGPDTKNTVNPGTDDPDTENTVNPGTDDPDTENTVNPGTDGSDTGDGVNSGIDGYADSDVGKTGSSNADNSRDTQTKESEGVKVMENARFTKNQVVSGKKLVFSDDTVTGYYLAPKTVPGNVHLKAGKNNITVYWSLPKNRSDVDGYILLRKSGSSSKYVQIANLKSSKTSYKDKKSLKKNVMYTYCLVSYKKEKALFISEKTSLWAGGVITKSDKVNVYSAVVCNKARLNCLMVGYSAVIDLKLPSGAVSKTVRWFSEDTSLATVDSKGKVTAKGVGKVIIRGKLPSGNFVNVTVNCMRGGTASSILAVMKSWLKYNERNKKHKGIVDIYNNYGKLPLNYKVTYRDAWCDACVTAAAITSGNVKRIGRECGVWRHVEIFKKKGIWIENGSITPKPGYIIVYSWEKKKQPNNGRPNHIGIVYSVKNGWITTIEGNYRDGVGKRRIPVGWGSIRGYARPKYKREASAVKK